MRSIFITVIFLYSILSPINIKAQEVGKIDTSSQAMVVAAHPEAVKIGIEIVEKGGNAVDAAVATAFMIGVVEPHASGLGGGGGMVIYLKERNSFSYIDYYMQTSLNPDTNYSREDLRTPRSICIPGTPAGLLKAHELYGSLPLKIILQPAIDIAQKGFVVSEKFYKNILDHLEVIMKNEETSNLFLKNEFPINIGDTVKNPQLASILKKLLTEGKDYFYKGEFAKKASLSIQENGGYITYDDFSNYQPVVKKPAKISYKKFEIYSSPPPQSGATMLEILNIFENYDMSDADKKWDSEEIHVFAEASKRADIDRYTYFGDPASVNVPLNGLLSQEYANERFADIELSELKYKNNDDIPPGNPWSYDKRKSKEVNLNDGEEGGHTTHISVIDKEGNAVSLTQTLGLFFGSGFTSQGIIFNSAMSIFYEKPSPNHIAPRRRPLSTISPTIIMKEDNLFSVIGTPGGGRIFNVVGQKIIELLDFKLGPFEAIQDPRFNVRIRSKYLKIENRFDKETILDLKEKGYNIKLYSDFDLYFGGVQMIYFNEESRQYIGVSDSRRDGGALGLKE